MFGVTAHSKRGQDVTMFRWLVHDCHMHPQEKWIRNAGIAQLAFGAEKTLLMSFFIGGLRG